MSRVSREVHARICGGVGVRFPCATRLNGFMCLYTNVDLEIKFPPFWCNPCKLLAVYTPHNKIGIKSVGC